jgi:hypothetical protein
VTDISVEFKTGTIDSNFEEGQNNLLPQDSKTFLRSSYNLNYQL